MEVGLVKGRCFEDCVGLTELIVVMKMMYLLPPCRIEQIDLSLHYSCCC